MSWTARPVDDAEVVRLSLVEPERFSAIFDLHFTEIHRCVAQRPGADGAEDVVAETFLTAFRKRALYDPSRAGGRAWLYGIATNLIGKRRRVEVRALRALGRHGPDPAPTVTRNGSRHGSARRACGRASRRPWPDSTGGTATS
ncbi:RNA polymerase sigma factor [Streptosporangium sp. V21-05]|uniref:RNA polymerase sigma factor n=1 Tax=Streptosporangium sp. V21-05 TaxID=3446115 RepID=UPI003F52EFB8